MLETAIEAFMRTAANMSGKRQILYKQKNGSLVFGPDGMVEIMSQFGYQDLKEIKIIYPDGQEPKGEKEMTCPT